MVNFTDNYYTPSNCTFINGLAGRYIVFRDKDSADPHTSITMDNYKRNILNKALQATSSNYLSVFLRK